jgi:hypothetical protein
VKMSERISLRDFSKTLSFDALKIVAGLRGRHNLLTKIHIMDRTERHASALLQISTIIRKP